METNESILVRDVVGLDDRRVIGKMRELRVDCDTLAVSHYVVTNAATSSPLVLPFNSVLAIGDTFATIQSREEFLSASSADAQALLADGFQLVGVDTFSRTGDRLGVVAGYNFDPVFGTVEDITLDNGDVYANNTFVFFAPEFVFVDTGALTLAEQREADLTAAAEAEAAIEEEVEEAAEAIAEAEEEAEEEVAEEADEAEEDAEPVAEVEETEIVEESDDAADAVEVEEAAEEAAEEEAAEEPVVEEEVIEVTLSEEDAQLAEILVGATLTNDVASEDGAFAAAKGTVLTREIVDEAIAHDALLLLTLAADL
ncbi:hypothetical protein [uncultured Adlercreutzia sp.]|uniref:hypothetical protein n=1 Tax=uncultured Adlercreutzia sp. TaxID=875803 RepID=UPI0025F59E3D|nr:hypothetical protein [uncultured Adlercreutzia sp.]